MPESRYDRFRGRLMISIRDARGRVIAFGARILGSGEPKYLNSPDTPLFRQRPHPLQHRPGQSCEPSRQAANRGRRLYGRHRARSCRHRRSRRTQRNGGHSGTARTNVAARSVANHVFRRRQRGPRRLQFGQRCALCPCSVRSGPCASSNCPRDRIPMTSFNPARSGWRYPIRATKKPAAMPLRRCSEKPNRWMLVCGATRSKASSPQHPGSVGWSKATPHRPCLDDRPCRSSDASTVRTGSDVFMSNVVPRVFGQPTRRCNAGATSKAGALSSRRRRSAGRPDSIASTGIDAPTARALILGFANYPEALPAHCVSSSHPS